uniref:Uncharacterized protein n=1 Tax=Pyrodinium bahamense TaxID=73915 RepID=A0A7S0A9M7_9DINO|mmetsp:Transcript_2822/g.7833  ORF Transcript_2822/g.7833 Transcript_2822/m.7833 type:complete len:287 (+) Transcript_2822:43-903(+)|eukprot:CAMPEP_0179102526 /NCGR_PEP_ID=MMETSP0796-20121207/47458_1 /TAXON_ID=73915 /ORGANISM="Pyrodinium bahamense, Strain pbaha01" /LENGTH=286 /DNA_ID=CAMNT_0020800405 /DNA_START=36 /DNA_END=896 /DNA_ORIENTATION=-
MGIPLAHNAMASPAEKSGDASVTEKIDNASVDEKFDDASVAEKFDDARTVDGSTSCSRDESFSSQGSQVDDTNQVQLVWCHEGCFRPTREALKGELEAAAVGVGVLLKCFKKAAGFSERYLGSSCQTYALLTDWREVKHCLQYALENCPQQLPVLTMILCSARQYSRALRWAERMGGIVGPIYVLMEVESPKWLVDEVLAALAPCLARPLPPPHATAEFIGLTSGMQLEVQGLRGDPHGEAAQQVQVEVGPQGPAMNAMLGIWSLCGDEKGVERLLLEAAPEHYED